jgi:hypothetical protein
MNIKNILSNGWVSIIVFFAIVAIAFIGGVYQAYFLSFFGLLVGVFGYKNNHNKTEKMISLVGLTLNGFVLAVVFILLIILV